MTLTINRTWNDAVRETETEGQREHDERILLHRWLFWLRTHRKSHIR
jgi:hypothetical protein